VYFLPIGTKIRNIQRVSKCRIQLIKEERACTIKHFNYFKAFIIANAEGYFKNLKTNLFRSIALRRPFRLTQPNEPLVAITAF
jgi:predicted oxidoreductase|tara:strand:- start:157 stop:405 length:249 start_codon:yes stop_codon:yes gene_type:complete